jgi:hypothetical protein
MCYPSPIDRCPEIGRSLPLPGLHSRRKNLSQNSPRSRLKRLETLNLVSCTHKDSEGRIDLEIVGRTLDLSEGGIFLEIPQPVPAGEKEMDVILGIRDHVIHIRGDIVHHRELENGYTGLGIAFRDISPEDSRVITAFLAEDDG